VTWEVNPDSGMMRQNSKSEWFALPQPNVTISEELEKILLYLKIAVPKLSDFPWVFNHGTPLSSATHKGVHHGRNSFAGSKPTQKSRLIEMQQQIPLPMIIPGLEFGRDTSTPASESCTDLDLGAELTVSLF
jgi:hypothetical protein